MRCLPRQTVKHSTISIDIVQDGGVSGSVASSASSDRQSSAAVTAQADPVLLRNSSPMPKLSSWKWNLWVSQNWNSPKNCKRATAILSKPQSGCCRKPIRTKLSLKVTFPTMHGERRGPSIKSTCRTFAHLKVLDQMVVVCPYIQCVQDLRSVYIYIIVADISVVESVFLSNC
jgi:hypothetical protein